MSRDRRGSTHRGRPSVVADHNYEPPPDVVETHDSQVITFSGEDGRSAVFSMAELPLPLWHPALCEAFTRRVGPAGSRRTQASANTTWTTMCRFIRFLDELPAPPATPQQLTAIQLDAYLRGRIRALRGRWGFSDFLELRRLLQEPPLQDLLSPSVVNYLDQRTVYAAPSVADGLLRRRILPFGRRSAKRRRDDPFADRRWRAAPCRLVDGSGVGRRLRHQPRRDTRGDGRDRRGSPAGWP